MNQITWSLISGIMFVLGILAFMIRSEGSVIVRFVRLIFFWLGMMGATGLCVMIWLLIFK